MIEMSALEVLTTTRAVRRRLDLERQDFATVGHRYRSRGRVRHHVDKLGE
jgi:hypothetical protein